MKHSIPRTGLIVLAVLLVCLLLGVTSASAATLSEVSCQVGKKGGGNTAVYPQTTATANYLFLPAAADLQNLTLCFEGESAVLSGKGGSISVQSGVPFDFTALCPNGMPEDGCPVTLQLSAKKISFTVMRSASIPALFLTSADPAKDRFWVAEDKDNKAKNGGIVLLRADGTAVYDGTMKNIKSRGNSTWYYPKTPYQFKLEEGADLLETGIPAEAQETWILLANYCDETLLHNSVSLALAEGLGIPFTPQYQQTDLYYDGEYMGTYLLCEKTEVGEGRVDIADMDKTIAEANAQIKDFDALKTATAKNNGGHLYQYVKGLNDPADLTGGYLLEIDYAERAKEEKCWFTTALGYYIVCKSPEFASRNSIAFISQIYQRFEDSICNGGVDATTGRDYTSFIDVDSLARCYLLMELAQDADAFRSSTYFYKNAGETILHAGPVWDFDSAYGSSDAVASAETLTTVSQPLTQYLLALSSFRETLSDLYDGELTALLDGMLYGEGGGAVPTLNELAAESAASQRMNAVRWPESSPVSYQKAIEELRSFMKNRSQLLKSKLTEWSDDSLRFFDVTEDAWYHDAVYYAAENGLFNGTSSGIFAPNQSMTRGMAVTVLYRMSGSPTHTAQHSSFTDVADGQWYTDGVLWATENGITNGCGDGTFQPNQKITRQEFAVFLYRMSGNPGSETPAHPFGDWNRVESFAVPAMNWAIANGLMKGDEFGMLVPGNPVTRAMAATLLQRYCEGGL